MNSPFRQPRARAFSLIEVALALAVSGFALVSIAGLLNVALDADGRAERDAAVVTMTDTVLTALSAAQFDSLWLAQPSASGSASPSTNAAADSHYYFSRDGTLVTDLTAVKPATISYECLVKKTPDEPTRSPDGGSYNLLQVDLQFYWPYQAQASAQRTPNRSIHACLARY